MALNSANHPVYLNINVFFQIYETKTFANNTLPRVWLICAQHLVSLDQIQFSMP